MPERKAIGGETAAGTRYMAHYNGEPSEETVKAVEVLVDAAVEKFADTLSPEEQAEYEASRRSIVEARAALPAALPAPDTEGER